MYIIRMWQGCATFEQKKIASKNSITNCQFVGLHSAQKKKDIPKADVVMCLVSCLPSWGSLFTEYSTRVHFVANCWISFHLIGGAFTTEYGNREVNKSTNALVLPSSDVSNDRGIWLSATNTTCKSLNVFCCVSKSDIFREYDVSRRWRIELQLSTAFSRYSMALFTSFNAKCAFPIPWYAFFLPIYLQFPLQFLDTLNDI